MTELSPAAQAVMTAFLSTDINTKNYYASSSKVAAALRAVADEVVPLHICGTTATRAQTRLGIRHKLLAIAAELDPTTTTPHD